MSRFPDIDWWCDSCNAYLNDQSGFSDEGGEWTCAECGHVNKIAESEIIYDQDCDQDEGQTLSVYDAADIWLSNGKDEDYTFGYSEEELEAAL